MKLSIASIRTDGGTQPRARIDEDLVLEYCQVIDALPPVTVFHDGHDHWLADGFHRLEAANRCGLEEIEADVHQGTQRDAILHACGANAEHGMRRTAADKRRAVLRLLTDAEWGKWSDREIARRCAVGADMVGVTRRSLSKTDSEPASTPPRKRAYTTKHGTQASMRTENIGRKPRSRAAGGPPPAAAGPEPASAPPQEPRRHPAAGSEEPRRPPAAGRERPDPIEREPPATDRATPQTAVAVFREYVDIIIGNVSGVNAKHMVINEMIKYLREMSITLNRKAGVA